MALSLTQPDPRSTQGQLARGANIYMGASNSPYAGKMTANSMAPQQDPAIQGMQTAPLLPQYKKPNLAEVARQFLNGNPR